MNTYLSNSETTHTSAPEGTYGPHTTRLANAADPRVDSDRDGRAAGAPTHAPTANTGITRTAGPNTNMNTGSTGTGENTGERVARGIKGVVAQGHVCQHPSSFFLQFPTQDSPNQLADDSDRMEADKTRNIGRDRIPPGKHQLGCRQPTRR
jgi:hypothetical protein